MNNDPEEKDEYGSIASKWRAWCCCRGRVGMQGSQK